jgi:4-hydroxy-4-methyl-2-oxoglutarate aldolase
MVARKDAESVLENSRARVAKEEITRKALMSGTIGLDYYGMRERLKEKGLRYVSHQDQFGEG